MNRALTVAAWSCALVGALVVGIVPLSGPLGSTAVVAVALVVGAAATAAVIVARRPPVTAVAIVALTSGVVADRALAGATDGALFLDWRRALAHLVLAAAVGAVIVRLLAVRRDGLPRPLLVDATSVVLGASLAAWILVVDPLIDRGIASAPTAILAAAHLPLLLLVVALTGSLIASGLHRSRAAWLLGAALALLAGSQLALGISAARASGDGAATPAGTLQLAALLLAAAAFVHPAIAGGLRNHERSPRIDQRMRMAVMLVGSTVPLVLVGAVPGGGSTSDRIVRAVGVVLIAAVGTWRLLQAVRASDRATVELLDRSRTDDLTQLPNRRHFLAQIDHVLDLTWRTERRPALILVNLDRFKNINDSLGHDTANDVLVAIAERLSAVADGFGGTMARLSGDEFALLDPDAGPHAADGDAPDAPGDPDIPRAAGDRADAVQAAFADPIDVDGRQVFVTASIGVVVAPRRRTITSDEFLRRADIAMHWAKTDGRNRVAVFDDSMQSSLTSRMDIEHALHGAIERQELRLAYQPIVDLATGQMNGFEALMRWERADGTLMPPDEFISIAEETGIINDLGAWALLQALTDLRHWIDDGTVAPDTTMSVNVSPRQVAVPAFSDVVREALERSRVPAHLLWLEVTESMMLSEPDRARATLRQIRAMGAHIALDDFGTGFSSLSLLQSFPLQGLKIDRGFVHGVALDGNDRSLVRTIIAMGTALGMDIVAEGVESVDQLMALRALRCPRAQGYLISRPVPAEAMSSTVLALRDLGSMPLFTEPGDVSDPVAPPPPPPTERPARPPRR